jgi:hypothetical protein
MQIQGTELVVEKQASHVYSVDWDLEGQTRRKRRLKTRLQLSLTLKFFNAAPQCFSQPRSEAAPRTATRASRLMATATSSATATAAAATAASAATAARALVSVSRSTRAMVAQAAACQHAQSWSHSNSQN